MHVIVRGRMADQREEEFVRIKTYYSGPEILFSFENVAAMLRCNGTDTDVPWSAIRALSLTAMGTLQDKGGHAAIEPFTTAIITRYADGSGKGTQCALPGIVDLHECLHVMLTVDDIRDADYKQIRISFDQQGFVSGTDITFLRSGILPADWTHLERLEIGLQRLS